MVKSGIIVQEADQTYCCLFYYGIIVKSVDINLYQVGNCFELSFSFVLMRLICTLCEYYFEIYSIALISYFWTYIFNVQFFHILI